ncbi:F-box family protein [Striga asiatica]|uniref:F-box family protein n=1 Tax=Striga asiatica TaxID=4170 RepID=A0A5A7NVV0_STRAF|nr:F-box family protein [Striga asiatica]
MAAPTDQGIDDGCNSFDRGWSLHLGERRRLKVQARIDDEWRSSASFPIRPDDAYLRGDNEACTFNLGSIKPSIMKDLGCAAARLSSSAMGILKFTTNLVANAKYKYKKFLSASYSSSIVRDVTAFGRGTCLVETWWHPPYLKPNISSNSLMLAVEHVSSSKTKTRDYSVISTEGGSFKVVHENLPNFSMLRAQTYYDVLASCNKWMFLRCKVVRKFAHMLLWNPTTYEVRPLPVFGWPPLLRDGVTLYNGWTRWGLGFDPSSEDYKVIRFGHMEPGDDEAHAVLFSLKTGSWKVIPDHHFPVIEPFDEKHVQINGITYWIASRVGSEWRCLSGEDDTLEDLAVVSFDFVNENFPPLIPTIPKSDRLFNMSCFCIAEFHGSLAAIFCDSVGFEIWVWKSNTTEWSLYSTYNFDDDDVCVESVLGLYKNDKALFQDSKGSLLLYDCHTRELKDLGIRGSSLMVYPYVQST